MKCDVFAGAAQWEEIMGVCLSGDVNASSDRVKDTLMMGTPNVVSGSVD